MKRWSRGSRSAPYFAAVGIACIACGPPRTPGAPVYPPGDAAPRDLYHVVFAQQITTPDNFVLRPDEYSAVAVDHERKRIYAGSRQGSLAALDHETGSILWELETGGQVSSRPVLTQLVTEDATRSLLLVGTDNGELLAIDPDTRDIVWRYATSGKIRRPPIVHEGVVYLVNSRDQVFALDLRTGAWRWQYEQDFQTDFTVQGRAGLTLVSSTALAAGEPGVLHTGFANGKLVALGAGSGEPLWTANLAPASGGDFVDVDTTPLVDAQAGVLYAAGQESGVYALGLADGQERWMLPMRGVGALTQAPTGDLIASSSLEGLVAIDRQGALLWRAQLDPGALTEPVVVGNTVFVAHAEQGLLAFDLDTGALLSRLDLGSGILAPPHFDAQTGRLYVTTNRGQLLALALEPDVFGASGEAADGR